MVINTLGALGFINGLSQKEISDMYVTLITPSPATFSIWSVIYSLLLISVIVMRDIFQWEEKTMKIQLWSKTTTGKWAAILTMLFLVLMVLKFSTFAIPLRLPVPSPFIAVLGVAGFIMGVISIVKNKDRAILTLLSIPIGLLIIFWVAAELAFPH